MEEEFCLLSLLNSWKTFDNAHDDLCLEIFISTLDFRNAQRLFLRLKAFRTENHFCKKKIKLIQFWFLNERRSSDRRRRRVGEKD